MQLKYWPTWCVDRSIINPEKENVFNQIVSFPAKFGIELDDFLPSEEIETLKPRIRDVKVFLSSTIKDLLKERQEIVTSLIPTMNEKLKVKSRNIDHFNFIYFSLHDKTGKRTFAVCFMKLIRKTASRRKYKYNCPCY